jgi:hypothetical protein
MRSPLDQLFAGDLAGWLAAAALPPDGLCLFLHVPKTAGTSLRTELAGMRQPDANIAVDYADDSLPFQERLDAAVERFLLGPGTERFASGHITASHALRIRAARPGTRVIAMLRDPVARVTSDWLHQASPRHPGHLAFRAAVPTLDAYLALPDEANKMARHLLPASMLTNPDPVACVAFLRETYAFIGLQERYDLGFRLLARWLGRPRPPTLRENVNEAHAAAAAPDAALVARIRAINALDAAIHAAFAAAWDAAAPALEAALAA